jgi:tRNA A-37 threonylcarbamoyl transferase component Bud32
MPERTAPGIDSAPIPLELPRGLVSEAAFRWPADPMARGGMAMIFAGEDRRLGRPVILKAPREGDDLPAGMAEMFQRRVTAEARILAKLQHPAIVTIYELGKASVGWPFCVMQRVEGKSLRERLDAIAADERDGRPRTRERLELLSNLIAIAEALAYAHERRVIHRDCTPNNILLGKRGEATLIDWGIARDLDAPNSDLTGVAELSPSQSGRMVTLSAGTPPYLPLEQTQGRAADPSFDVYSFGVTLYEVIAGRTPFEWVETQSVQQRQRQLDHFLRWLKSGETAPPAMPKDPELSGIIARAMARDAAHRFTADELVLALKQYLTGDLVFSHRYSRSGRLARWVRRNRAATIALVTVLVAGAATAVVYEQQEAAAQRAQNKELQAEHARHEAEDDAARAQGRATAAETQREAAERDKARAQQDDADAQHKSAIADQRAKQAHDAQVQAQRLAHLAQGSAEEAHRLAEVAQADRDAALADRDAALAAKTVAEQQRDAANAARTAADRDRDRARAAQLAAEKERDSAHAAQAVAEHDRDAARTAQSGAERDRDEARAAQSAAEHDRDTARKQLVILEAKLKKLESAAAAPTTGQPPNTLPQPE